MALRRLTAASFACSGAALLVAAAAMAATDESPCRVMYRGATTLPQSVVDRAGRTVPIGGLSGVTWLGGDRYVAIMDNSDKLLLFSLELTNDGRPRDPSELELVTLAEAHDYEDVAVCPESLQRRIAASQVRRGLPDPGRCLLVAEEDTPAIRVASLTDGDLLGIVPIPEAFASRRLNRGLESLAIEADGRHAWTSTEEALPTDGPAATADQGTVVRLARITLPEPDDRETKPRQVAYRVEQPHAFVRLVGGQSLSGVAALTGLGDGRLLVLERSGCPGLPPFENRIYLVDPRSSADVAEIDRDLAEKSNSHVVKTLLWKDQLGCNIEGLCHGPTLRGGDRALIAVADNNEAGTPSQVISFVIGQSRRGLSFPLMAGAAATVLVVAAVSLYRLVR